ncbi:MAG: DUF192 domain-containing protein [Fermentimonas sp.]|jgi:uncharacterized membrane protein (UPF0127 family)
MTNKKNKNKRVYLISLLIVALGLIVFFSLPKNRQTNQPLQQDKSLEIQFNKQGELYFIDGSNNDTISIIDIEIAQNDQARARGLMYRKSLPQDAGMLFIQDYEDIQGFWMKNTYIPLDMIFTDKEGVIVTIHQNTTPLSEQNYASSKPSIYVVEVNAGYCSSKGINVGDKILFNR